MKDEEFRAVIEEFRKAKISATQVLEGLAKKQ